MEITKSQIKAISHHLLDKGIYKVQIDFSGAGDSGDIDEVEFFDTQDNAMSDIEISQKLLNRIEDFFYDEINNKVNEVGDWVNNEGGYGSLYYFPETKTVKVDYYQRTVEDYDFPESPLFI